MHGTHDWWERLDVVCMGSLVFLYLCALFIK